MILKKPCPEQGFFVDLAMKKNIFLISLFIAVFVFLIYYLTLAPSLSVFSFSERASFFRPFGSAGNLNMLSAVLCSLSVAILFLAISEMRGKKDGPIFLAMALSLSLIFSFSAICWSRAVIAGAFPAGMFFFSLALYFAIRHFRRPIFFVLLTVFICLMSLLIFSGKISIENNGDLLIFAFILFIVWIAILCRSLFRMLRKKISIMILSFLLLSAPFFFIAANFHKADRSADIFIRDYCVSLLNSLEPDSILALGPIGSSKEIKTRSILYFHDIEKYRPDVMILPKATGTRQEILEKAMDIARKEGRPLYTDFLLSGGPRMRSNGLLYKIFTGAEEADEWRPGRTADIKGSDNRLFLEDPGGADLAGQYYYSKAAFLLERGQYSASQQAFIKGIELDDDPYNEDFNAFVRHRAEIKGRAL